MDKEIVVFFIKLNNNKPNTASENRFRAIYEMTRSNFRTELFETKKINDGLLKFKFSKIIMNRLRIIESSFRIIRKKNNNDINVLYLFGVDPVLSLFYYLYGKYFNILLINERNEFPKSIINERKVYELLERIFLYNWYYKIYNGYSLISDELINHYRRYLSPGQVITKLPMTVDFSRFNNLIPNQSIKYIFFAGSLINKKDGIDFLIHAFADIHEKLNDIFLFIASNSRNYEYHQIEKIIRNIDCNKIKLLGPISRDNIPQYIVNSLVCVLPRPDSPQARGGFPTKLGEYLASGRPVIVSDVGEIGNFLTETEVYFVSHNNLELDIKDRLLEIFRNYNNATRIGLQGKIKAFESFSLKSNNRIIKKFINDIAEKNYSKWIS